MQGLAYEVLGWRPRLSDLDTIVSTAWSWHAGMADVRRASAIGARMK